MQGVIVFREGGDGVYTHIFGKVSKFETKEAFLQQVLEECESELEDVEERIGKLQLTEEHVTQGVHVRYYPNGVHGIESDPYDPGVYTFCDEGKGSFEVYVIDFRDISNSRTEVSE